MSISAEFVGLDAAARESIVLQGKCSGTAEYEITGPTWSGNRATWQLTLRKVGALTAFFSAKEDASASGVLGEETRTYTVVADLLDFIMAVQGAQTMTSGRYSAAASYLNSAVRAFRQAQEDQEAALKDVGASEKLTEDLVWGALFAAAGGVAGGVAGSRVKQRLENLDDIKLGKASVDGFTDTAKDTVKFAVRSVDRLRGGGGGRPSTGGDSTSPVDPTTKSGKERSAAGENPLDFLTSVAAQIANDESIVQARLGMLIKEAREARAANTKADFDEDPSDFITKDSEVIDIFKELSTDKRYYVRALWRTWLETYAYQAVITSQTLAAGRYTGPAGKRAESRVSGKLRKKILTAAEKCGEDGEQWIKEFSEKSRLKAEQEATQFMKPGAPQ